MDIELLYEIRNEIQGNMCIEELDEKEALQIIDVVAKKHIKDRSRVWWWEGLNSKPSVIEYGDGFSWPMIRDMIKNDNQLVYLFVTDDEPEPWPVFRGTLHDIGILLAGMWRFEYFLSDKYFSWLIFDTHHNDLLVAGALSDRAVGFAKNDEYN